MFNTVRALCILYHVPTLYGIPIPPGAHQVEVRPVFGRGQRRLLYRGPVERDGVFVTEDDIADHVAADAAFWQYVAAQVSAKALQPGDNGTFSFKLSVCFQDQHGAPATLDPNTGITSRVTADAWDFYRASNKGEDQAASTTLANALAQLSGKQVDLQSAQTQASVQIAQALTQCVQGVAATVIKETMAPLIEAQKLIAEQARQNQLRADGLTVDLFKRMDTRPSPSGNGLGLVRDLLGVAREAKTLLN